MHAFAVSHYNTHAVSCRSKDYIFCKVTENKTAD